MIIECSGESKELKEYCLDIFGNRKIYTELGYPVFNDDDKIFFLLIEEGSLIGFCAAKKNGLKIRFCNFYVFEKFRKKGYGTKLFNYRYDKYKNKTILAVATKDSRNFYVKRGFEISKETKRYTFFIKEAAE